MELSDLAFFAAAGLSVGSGAVVATTRDIVRAVQALVGTLMGFAGLFALLAAPLAAAAQIVVYIGGVGSLTLMAALWTREAHATTNRRAGVIPAVVLTAAIGVAMGTVVLQTDWAASRALAVPIETEGDGTPIGLPLGLAAAALVAAIVGAVTLLREELGPS